MPLGNSFVRVTGADQLRAVARDLALVGDGKVLRKRLRHNITLAVQPMKKDVQAAALAIPAQGSVVTGLRAALARATRLRIRGGGPNTMVRLEVAPSRMPAGQQSLPALMEGVRPWRHPLFGNTNDWYPQAAHPFFGPAVKRNIGKVELAVLAAVEQTAAEVNR